VYKFYSPDWIIAAEENYMTPAEATNLLYKKVLLQRNNANIFNRTCDTMTFNEYKEDAFKYISTNYRMISDTITGKGTRGLNPKQLGIVSDSIEVVEIYCHKSYYEIFIISSEEIIIEYKSTFFFLKRVGSSEPRKENFSGAGSITKEMTLTGKETSIKLSYDFYKEPDELIVYDQNNKELHRSGMRATAGTMTEVINIYNVTKLVFKVETKETNSKWKFSVTAE
jgi:hypothetical protein